MKKKKKKTKTKLYNPSLSLPRLAFVICFDTEVKMVIHG